VRKTASESQNAPLAIACNLNCFFTVNNQNKGVTECLKAGLIEPAADASLATSEINEIDCRSKNHHGI
jgi:hypothetical protein